MKISGLNLQSQNYNGFFVSFISYFMKIEFGFGVVENCQETLEFRKVGYEKFNLT